MENYSRIKEILKTILEEARKDALENGVDTTSLEFKKIIDLIKTRVLENVGVSVAEFDEVEQLKQEKKLIKKKEERNNISQEIKEKTEKIEEDIKQVEAKEIKWEDIKGKPDISSALKKLKQEIQNEIKTAIGKVKMTPGPMGLMGPIGLTGKAGKIREVDYSIVDFNSKELEGRIEEKAEKAEKGSEIKHKKTRQSAEDFTRELVQGLGMSLGAQLDDISIDALNDIGDVNAGSPNDNDALTWDSATSKWIPEAVTIKTDLDSLDDVTIASPTDAQILTYESATSTWKNKAAPAAGATIELDNLGTVAINTSLISDTDSTDNLGSSAKFWANTYTDKLYFQANAFLQYESIYGGIFISGQSSSDGLLKFLSKGNNISINVRSGGALYGMTVLANVTYGVRLSATKAGGAGHFVIATGNNIYPESDSSNDLGSSTLLWANIYTDLLHLSSTINLDGSETGILKINAADIRPDLDSTRDLGAADVVAKDQFEEGTGNQNRGFRGAVWVGQSFTSGSGITNVSKVETMMKHESGTPDTVFCDIYLAAGDDKPMNSSLGQASIPAMDSGHAWRVFTFSPPVPISALTKYVIVISSPGSTGWQRWKANTANPYADGVVLSSTDSGGTWSVVSGTDFLFKTFTASDFYWAEAYVGKLFLNSTATLDGATAGQITVVGDMVFSGSGSGLVFGEIYVRDNTTITTLNSSAKVQITIFDTNGQSNSSTPDHTEDHIVIDKSGKYLVIASVHVKNNASQSHVININVYKENGTVAFDNLHANRSLTGGSGDVASISISGIIDISATDTLELWADTDVAADRSVTFEDITLSIVQIGG